MSWEEIARKEELATRGKDAEACVRQVLEAIMTANPEFDYQRLPDARSCMGRIPQQIGDYLYFMQCEDNTKVHGVIEVKQVKTGYRLARSAFPQWPMIKRRAKTGAKSFVLLFTKETGTWKIAPYSWLVKNEPEKGSWNMAVLPTVSDLHQALITTLANYLR